MNLGPVYSRCVPNRFQHPEFWNLHRAVRAAAVNFESTDDTHIHSQDGFSLVVPQRLNTLIIAKDGSAAALSSL